MKKTTMEARTTRSREHWRERIAEERSGLSVQRFCKDEGLTEQSFYLWRKRLLRQQPARFALVEKGPAGQPATEPLLELILKTGERLRIGAGADPAALRKVLEALRA
jgi:hypothetical protein